jgi:hypothetical protein
VPTDPSPDPAIATTRRSFLARAAVGGALVTAAGVAAGPLGSLVGTAGAQDGLLASDLYSDVEFGLFATPLELAAVQAYLAADRSGLLSDEWADRAREFGRHHQAVADTLNGLRGPEASRAVPDPDLLASSTAAIEGAADEVGVLGALADLESTLAATHLAAVELMREQFTAGIATQVLLVESQQAALLAVAASESIESATPAIASTDGALTPA